MIGKLRPRAIVIEDDYSLRTLIDNVLTDRGYEVRDSSGPCLSSIFLDSKCSCPVGTHCTNIIITDINMPDMTGLEFIEHQKRNECKVQNIAVMSGGWTDEKIKHAKKLCCHIFEKPFKIDEIEKWLDGCERKSDPHNKLSDLPMHMIKQQ